MYDIHGLICPICRNHEAHQFKHTNEGHHICLCCDFEFYFSDYESELQCKMAYTQLQTFRFDEARDTFDIVLQKHPHDETALWGYLQAVRYHLRPRLLRPKASSYLLFPLEEDRSFAFNPQAR